LRAERSGGGRQQGNSSRGVGTTTTTTGTSGDRVFTATKVKIVRDTAFEEEPVPRPKYYPPQPAASTAAIAQQQHHLQMSTASVTVPKLHHPQVNSRFQPGNAPPGAASSTEAAAYAGTLDLDSDRFAATATTRGLASSPPLSGRPQRHNRTRSSVASLDPADQPQPSASLPVLKRQVGIGRNGDGATPAARTPLPRGNRPGSAVVGNNLRRSASSVRGSSPMPPKVGTPASSRVYSESFTSAGSPGQSFDRSAYR
jgi:hypothetical protein